MYYRRKVLLALIEAFGGNLNAVDCHKLMFLLCQYSNRNHYDFFPYKYGAISFVLHQDKLRLTELGHLENGETFHLLKPQMYLDQIEASTQQEILSLVQEIGPLRGDKLLRKVYKAYPYYASRSEVGSKILGSKDYKKVLASRNTDETLSLFTIGYESITVDAYLNTLIANNAMVLADVRKNPISKKYGFSKHQLEKYVENIGISYVHFPELGVPSHMRQNLDTEQSLLDLFQFYSEHILPNQIATLNELRNLVYEKKRIALTCFEAHYKSCHRSKIAEYFQSDPSFDVPIVHL